MYVRHSIKSKTPLLFRAVSLYAVAWLVLLFVFCILVSMNDVSHNLNPLSIPRETIIASSPVLSKTVIDGEPQLLSINRLEIILPIKYGAYDDITGKWTLSGDAVYYAQMTSLPNNQHGSTFLYGHNTDHVFSYSYVSDSLVPPDLTAVLYDMTIQRLRD